MNASSSQVSLDAVSWMAGYWVGEHNGTHIEEIWLPPAGGLMVGLHRDVLPSGRSFFEYLRIEATGDTLVYVASPMGRTPTRFPARLIESRRVLFENPDHDFPQRIEYRLDDQGRLQAAASGREGETDRKLQWTWEKQPFPGD